MLPATWDMLQANCTIEEFVSIDNAVVTAEEKSVEDFVAEQSAADSDNSDDDKDECMDAVPTSAEANAAVEVLRKYLSSVDGGENNFEKLYKLEKQIEDMRYKRSKQQSILDYFSEKQ